MELRRLHCTPVSILLSIMWVAGIFFFLSEVKYEIAWVYLVLQDDLHRSVSVTINRTNGRERVCAPNHNLICPAKCNQCLPLRSKLGIHVPPQPPPPPQPC